jgi:CRP-like cAMP-binding protein
MIVAGSVRVTTYSSAGREISFRDLAEGTSYGELSALDGRPRSADVVALSTTLIASLPPASFLALLREEWSVNEKVLLRLARAAGVARNRARIDPAPKHAEMASLVSTYREQITRELSALVKAGVLAKDGGALVVQDFERLQRLAAEASTH